MNYQEDLNRLENIVEKILGGYKDLNEKKLELEIINLEHESTINRLQDEINSLREERTIILQRLSSLIETIENWEKDNVQVEENSHHSEH